MVESQLSEDTKHRALSDLDEPAEKSPDGRFMRVSVTQYRYELYRQPQWVASRGLDNETGCEVAWHSVSMHHITEGDLPRILKELANLQHLQHPNLLNWVDHWYSEADRAMIFITESIPQGSLREYLHKIKSPRLKVVKQWTKQLLEVLAYLHAHKPFPVIYGYLSPDSIYCIPNTGKVKIGGLGRAVIFHKGQGQVLTRKYECMAPELLQEEPSAGMDVYSLGMCLLEICTQSIPYDECKTPVAVTRKIITGHKPLALSRVLSEEVKDFISLCLSPREERPSASELLSHSFVLDFSNEACSRPVPLAAKCETPCPEGHNTIEVEMMIPQGCWKSVKLIEFPFDLDRDTPDAVAEEMVEELHLPQEITPSLSRQISTYVLYHDCPTLSSSRESMPEVRWPENDDDYLNKWVAVEQELFPDTHTQDRNFVLLKYGAENCEEEVKALQSALLSIYETCMKADGVFNKKTESLVKQFQADSGLEVTGTVGRDLWTRITEQGRFRDAKASNMDKAR